MRGLAETCTGSVVYFHTRGNRAHFSAGNFSPARPHALPARPHAFFPWLNFSPVPIFPWVCHPRVFSAGNFFQLFPPRIFQWVDYLIDNLTAKILKGEKRAGKIPQRILNGMNGLYSILYKPFIAFTMHWFSFLYWPFVVVFFFRYSELVGTQGRAT